jgi:hypothetical protein
MQSVAADVRYAVRALRRRPAFSIVATLTLALGIGANAAIFSAVRGILLTPLPFRAPERLVSLNAEQFVGNAELLHLREHARTLDGVAAISPGWGMALTGTGEAMQLTTSRVSTNLLDVLGVRPMLGRTFVDGESVPGRETVALLGHALWVERFGGDRSVVGKSNRPRRYAVRGRRCPAARLRSTRTPRGPLDTTRHRPHRVVPPRRHRLARRPTPRRRDRRAGAGRAGDVVSAHA